MDVPRRPRPRPGQRGGANARPGTDELLVGEVDQVQVRSPSRGGAARRHEARGGRARHADDHRAERRPSTPTDESRRRASPARPTEPRRPSRRADGPDDRRTASTSRRRRTRPEPQIYSRAQWGADERMRDKGSLHYYEVHAGFVHHTVNANNYTRDEVPGIIRSIYAYHTQSRGWSDIGYNFLVDRFGRIWEGRYGGVDRAVVGAHTLGLQRLLVRDVGDRQLRDRAAAEGDGPGVRRPVRLEALAARRHRRLHASGSAPRTSRRSTATATPASTACPGRYLYAKIAGSVSSPPPPRRGGPAGSWSRTSAQDRSPGPDRAAGQRRQGLHPSHQRDQGRQAGRPRAWTCRRRTGS